MAKLLEIVDALADVFDRLQVLYAISGALANNFWGIVRTTQDIDCLIAVPTIKLQLLADGLNEIGCSFRNDAGEQLAITVPILREQINQQKFIECHCGLVLVELFVPIVHHHEEILRRAIPIKLGAREVPVITAEDLILLKLVFHRPKDLQDIRGILWVQRGRLDLDYMRHWSARTHESDVQAEMEQLIADYSTD
jgi:predicted nucleotidyltransferase